MVICRKGLSFCGFPFAQLCKYAPLSLPFPNAWPILWIVLISLTVTLTTRELWNNSSCGFDDGNVIATFQAFCPHV